MVTVNSRPVTCRRSSEVAIECPRTGRMAPSQRSRRPAEQRLGHGWNTDETRIFWERKIGERKIKSCNSCSFRAYSSCLPPIRVYSVFHPWPRIIGQNVGLAATGVRDKIRGAGERNGNASSLPCSKSLRNEGRSKTATSPPSQFSRGVRTAERFHAGKDVLGHGWNTDETRIFWERNQFQSPRELNASRLVMRVPSRRISRVAVSPTFPA